MKTTFRSDITPSDGNAIRGILIGVPLGMALYALIWWALSCVPLATDYRKVGFRDMQRAFVALEPAPDLYETVTLEKVTVHIVGDRRKMNWDRASAMGSGVLGYARRNGEIWVLGTVVDGRIVLNQAVLGHEVNHLLRFADPNVADPDRLDKIGA